MSQESDDDLNDPLDDEMDGAMLAAMQLVTHVKQMQSTDLELPIMDQSCMWMVTVRRIGICE
jgi:hypothetical protein